MEAPVEIRLPTQQFVDSLPDAVVIVDRDGRMVIVNDKTWQLFGYRREELLHRPVELLLPERFRIRHPGQRRSFFDNPHARPMGSGLDLYGRRKDGSEFPAEISISPMNADGQTLASTIIRDVTERRQLDLTLRRHARELEDFVENSSIGLHWVAPDGTILRANRAELDLLGYTREEYVGHHIREFHADPESIDGALRSLARGEDLRNYSTRMICRDGSLRDVLIDTSVYREDGEFIHTRCFTRDITGRRRTEAALREREARLQLIFDSTSDIQMLLRVEPGGVFVTEAVNRALIVNTRACRGMDATECLGQDVAVLLAATGLPAEEIERRRLLYRKVVCERVTLIHHAPLMGIRPAAEVSISPVVDQDGRCTHVLCTARIETERVKAEADLRESEARLQLIFDSTTDLQALFRVEPGGRFILEMVNRALNETFATVVGLNAPQFVGRELEEFLKPTGLTEEEMEFRRSMCQKAAREKTVRNYTGPQGPRREAVEVSLSPVLDQNGECTHLLWNARVVTDRVRAEAELREREERLRLIFNAHQDLQSLIRVEPGGRFVNEAFNQAYLDFSKQFIPNPNAFLERGRDEFLRALGLPEDEVERAVAYWREVAAKKTPARSEVTYTFDAGRRLEIGDITVVPILNRDGVCTHLLWTGHFITERKRAEEELRKRERELAEAQSIGHIGSWAWDLPDKLAWSDEMFRILGLEPQLFPPTFHAFLERVHPDERENIGRAIWAHAEARTPHDLEHRIVRPDGTERFVHTRSIVQFDSSGQPLRVLGTIHDVTEERQAAAREAGRLRRLKQLSELSMMLAGDPSTVFERVVRMIGELFEVRVVCLSEIVGRDLAFRAVYADGKVMSNAGGCPLEITPCATVEADKEIRIYERVQELFPQAPFLRDHDAYSFCGSPSLDNRGHVVAVTCLLDDKPHEYTEEDQQILRVIGQRIATEFDRGKSIAERARMEEALRENKRTLEEAQYMAHLGNYTGDLTTGRMEWSDEMYRIYEIDPAQGSPGLDVVLARAHPDDRAVIQGRHQNLVHEPGRFEIEHRLMMPDGRIKHVLVQGDVISGADGRPRTNGTVQDVTERKHAEQEREKLQMQLLQAQKLESIGRLAGGVAHDFNNLLTVINGYASLVLGKMHRADPDRQAIENIHRAGDTAAQLVRQLLAFSRRQILNPERVSLNSAVSNVENILGRLVPEGVEIVYKLTPDPYLVMADRTQIEQVIINLAVNARDAMPRGGRLTIETRHCDHTQARQDCGSVLPPGDYVELIVRDTGTGMDEHIREHLFEPFFTTKEPGKGTGLGLSTVHGIVSQSGGCVGVETEPGKGSAFYVYLPAAEGAPEEVKPAPVAEPVRGKETVLLVEDKEDVRRFIADVLENLGYKVVEAEDAEQALRACSSQLFDLLLTDVVMPGMSGAELAERAGSVQPAMRILLMSGYSDAIGKRQGAGSKAIPLLQKPFTPRALAAKVREVLGPVRAAGHDPGGGR